MIFSIDGLCLVLYKFCKFKASWIKYGVFDFLGLRIRLKLPWHFYLPVDLIIRNINAVPRADLHTVKVWCKSVYKFWSYMPKCDFVQMATVKRKGKWIVVTSVAFSSSCRYVLTSLDTMLLSPAVSPQTWWQTDTQTVRQTNRVVGWKTQYLFSKVWKGFITAS